MSNSNNNQLNIPQAREAMDKFKMQTVQEVGINLQSGYSSHLPPREAGSDSGQICIPDELQNMSVRFVLP